MDLKDIPGLGSVLGTDEDLNKLREFIENLPGKTQDGSQTPPGPGIGASLGKVTITSGDVQRLKTFLKGMSEADLDKVVESQTRCITDQYLLVNKEGSAFGRMFIDGTVSTVNTKRFWAAGYSIFTEKSFSGDLQKTLNYCSDYFWSCGCKTSYIHHRNQIQCKICGTYSCDDTKKYTPINELVIK